MKIPRLIDFVKEKHAGQVRKYTGEPYYNHLFAVASMADNKCPFGFEMGLCHDLLEDTDCTLSELQAVLANCGYSDSEICDISRCVFDLTDEFTHKKYFQINRKFRKKAEALRLHHIEPDAQTVKYCDIINNTESIVKHDRGFAIKYLAEIRDVLNGMNRGNPELYSKCLDVLRDAEIELNKQLTI